MGAMMRDGGDGAMGVMPADCLYYFPRNFDLFAIIVLIRTYIDNIINTNKRLISIKSTPVEVGPASRNNNLCMYKRLPNDNVFIKMKIYIIYLSFDIIIDIIMHDINIINKIETLSYLVINNVYI